MPWRSFINADFETTETTDMSSAKLESMVNAGWWEARGLELQLARLCQDYGVGSVMETLTGLINKANEATRSNEAKG